MENACLRSLDGWKVIQIAEPKQMMDVSKLTAGRATAGLDSGRVSGDTCGGGPATGPLAPPFNEA